MPAARASPPSTPDRRGHGGGGRKADRGIRRRDLCARDLARADLAIVKAWKGDTEGNLIYRKTARNFNPMMATAGKVTIAEVEELVEPGRLDPNDIHTPGIFVQRILQGKDYKKQIERVTTRPRPGATGGNV